MKIEHIKIKGITSHRESHCSIENYTVFVGENNTGKSNILTALRWFFGEIKLEKEQVTNGYHGEPSIEIKFRLEEKDKIKEDFDKKYIDGNYVTIRAYCNFESEDKPQSSKLQLVKDKEEPKELKKSFVLGEVIFVPSMRELSDELKLTANSTINKLISKFVVERIRSESGKANKYQEVNTAIKNLSDYISQGQGSAFDNLKKALKKHMLDYPGIEINFKLEPPVVEDLIKNCFRSLVKTPTGELSISTQGMGFQRSFIFSLVCAVSELEMDSDKFTLYLIEEPELFLHPNHQSNFRGKLMELAKKTNNQVMITTHSTYFINNISNYSEIKRISLVNNYSDVKEITQDQIKDICKQNGKLMALAINEAKNPKLTPEQLKGLEDSIAEQDELRYLLWVDPERANAFLSKKVILIEGKTEKAFFSYLLNNAQGYFFNQKGVPDISIIDVNGKFHFYKFAMLLHKLGIPCWIMYDGDEDRISNGIHHQKLNGYVEQLKIDGIIQDCLRLDPEIEICLGFGKDEHKPDIAMYHNLIKNQETCKGNLHYKSIISFVEKIVAK